MVPFPFSTWCMFLLLHPVFSIESSANSNCLQKIAPATHYRKKELYTHRCPFKHPQIAVYVLSRVLLVFFLCWMIFQTSGSLCLMSSWQVFYSPFEFLSRNMQTLHQKKSKWNKTAYWYFMIKFHHVKVSLLNWQPVLPEVSVWCVLAAKGFFAVFGYDPFTFLLFLWLSKSYSDKRDGSGFLHLSLFNTITAI